MERSRYEGWALAALRVVAAILFMQHGVQKLFGWLGGTPVETLISQKGLAGVLEAFGGLLILLGLFTRPVALVLAGEMAVAYFQVHAPQAFWPIQNRGELAAMFCFVFLYLAARGGGPWSVDGWRARRKSEGPPTS